MIEFGIFSDEGLLEGDFHSREEAEAARVARYVDDGARVGVVCPECHENELPQGEVSGCPDCGQDEEAS
jgi:hypothetical protein